MIGSIFISNEKQRSYQASHTVDEKKILKNLLMKLFHEYECLKTLLVIRN